MGQMWLIVKGADEQMLPLMNPSEAREVVYSDLFTFAREGLRTLVYGYRTISKDIAEQWCKDYQLAEFNKDNSQMKEL